MGLQKQRMPVFFFSHGGPTFIYEGEEGGDIGAFHKMQEIGREITEKIKPKAILVFSAHWQSSPSEIEIATNQKSELIYDFYGFPKYMYQETFPHTTSPELVGKVSEILRNNGIKYKTTERGLDHGVWVPFKVVFPQKNPCRVPIVQISLYGNEDPIKHYELGQALAPLRDEEVLIICSGMSVHNLRDLFMLRSDKPTDYSRSFDEALKVAVTSTVGDDRKRSLVDILKRSDAKKAHPTLEHLLPIHIAAGAAGVDTAKRLYSNQVGSMAWGQFRFG